MALVPLSLPRWISIHCDDAHAAGLSATGRHRAICATVYFSGVRLRH